ncbi:MAG: AAA family ATPase [Dehalococcoidia bacterium]|nr:MAG: AAA family ATPase [Dehalococcoidia bacterium]
MSKLAITGKGGVGKTTLASVLARLHAADGHKVLAIDADPDANLGAALGISNEELKRITPIAQLEELIHERTGSKPGTVGGMFKLNPQVDDIPDRFSISKDGIRLLVLGTVKKGGSGCICPESALLKSLLTHLLLRRDEMVILDMEAGIEHLGRGTAAAVDAFITVVEPGMRSLETAQAVRKLAEDIGIKQYFVVGNKIEHDTDRQFITDNLHDFTVLGFISQNPKIVEADRKGISPYDLDPKVVSEVKAIREQLAAFSR